MNDIFPSAVLLVVAVIAYFVRWHGTATEYAQSQQQANHKNTHDDSRDEQQPPPSTQPKSDMELQYAKVLGLSGNISPDDLKRRWRDLSKQYHPDNVQHLGPKLREVAEREMKDINIAYQYFKNKYGLDS